MGTGYIGEEETRFNGLKREYEDIHEDDGEQYGSGI